MVLDGQHSDEKDKHWLSQQYPKMVFIKIFNEGSTNMNIVSTAKRQFEYTQCNTPNGYTYTIYYILHILPNCGHPLLSKPSKSHENFRTLLLEAEAAVTSCCDGCYSTVASG